MTIGRPTSIYISEDTWTKLENTMNGNINPFYLNPEERFKNDNNGIDAKLEPIQEDEIPEMTYVEGKSKSLDDESLQITENDILPTSLIVDSGSPLTTRSPELTLQSTVSTEKSSEPVLPNTDSEIEETSVTDKSIISSINTVSIPEEPSPTNLPISNISASE